MGDYISSSKEIADDYANRIAESVSYLDPSSLDGVDDDNTLAESGLYSTYYYLKSMLEQFKQTMRVEAANLRSAASAINEADSASTEYMVNNALQKFQSWAESNE